MRRHALLLLFCFTAIIVEKIEPIRADTSELAAELDRIREEHNMFGVAYAIVKDGRVSEGRALGTLGPDGEDLTLSTPMRLGSISKNVTALTALVLAHRGVVDLDAPVAQHLPPTWSANPWATTEPITLRMLLEHTSGLPGSSYAEYADAPAVLTPTEVVSSFRGHVRWRPGRFYSYSNMGITVAAAVLEGATGRSFDHLVEELVFAPLGLETARFDWDNETSGMLRSFVAHGEPAHFWTPSIRPAGSLVMSITDFGRYTAFLAGSYASVPVGSSWAQGLSEMLSAKTSLAARSGYTLSYGLGTFGFLEAGHVFWGHWGKIDGSLAAFGVLPGTARGFAVISNTGNRQGFAELRRTLAEHISAGFDFPRLAVEFPPRGRLHAAGWYRPFTDDMETRAWITSVLGLKRVDETAGGLTISSGLFPVGRTALRPIEDTIYAASGYEVGTHVFTKDDGEMFMLGDQQNTYRRLSMFEGIGHLVSFWIVLVGVALLLVYGLVQLARTVGGSRVASRSLAPLFLGSAALALVLLQALHVYWGMLSPLTTVAKLGTKSPHALTLTGLSILWPVLSVVGIWLLLRSFRLNGALAQISLGLGSLGLAISAVFLARNGWIPLFTWT